MSKTEATPQKRRRGKKVWLSIGGAIMALTTIGASIVTIVAGLPAIASIMHPPSQVTSVPSELQRTPNLGLEFLDAQDKPYNMSQLSYNTNETVIRVEADKAPFQIRGPHLSDGMHVCAWTDDSIFALKWGESFEAMNYDSPFVPGKGLADTQSGTPSLKLTPEYNTFWIDDRLNHVSSEKDSIYVSELDDTLISSWDHDRLYLVIWIDRDDDGQIDYYEFERIVIELRQKVDR